MRVETAGQRWLRGVLALVTVGLLGWTAAPAAMAETANDIVLISEDDLFSLNEDDLFSFDEDALFGGGGLLTDVEDHAEQSLEEVFLVRERIDVGGSYRAALGADREWDGDGRKLKSNVTLTAGGDLYLDARPRRDFRAFAKLKADGVWTDERSDAEVKLHELFADFVVGERAFFRVGKQTVTWGVGYFFSPADVINIGQIDPEDPDAEREGPVAIRLNVPSGRNNWYGYAVISGNADDGYRVALAPKAEFVLGRSELGIGLYYHADRAPRAMATLSTSVGPMAVFGELVASKGSDKLFIGLTTPTASNPLGLGPDEETLFLHATGGARYTYSDPDARFSVTAAGQYYYDGEGFDRTPRHYGALLVTGSHERLKDLNASVLWLGDLTGGTGTVTVSLEYSGWKHIRPGITVSRMYGDLGSPLGIPIPVTTATFGVSVSGSF